MMFIRMRAGMARASARSAAGATAASLKGRVPADISGSRHSIPWPTISSG